MRSHGGDAAGGTVRLIVARPRRRIGNVPAEATSFVGRRRELAEIRKALVAARLVIPRRNSPSSSSPMQVQPRGDA